MNLLTLGGWFSDTVADIWMSIWLSLNNVVYIAIEWLYKVFMAVANVNIFSDAVFKELTSRMYIVISIAMLFIFAYNLILMIINPEDRKSTGQTTQFIKDVLISIILIILLPTIFNYMAILQRHILESNIIGQIIMGNAGSTEDDCNYDQYKGIFEVNNIGNVQMGDGIEYWFKYQLDGTYRSRINNGNFSATDYLTAACNNYMLESSEMRGAATIPVTLFSAFYHPTSYGYYECKEYMDTCKDSSELSTCSTAYIADDTDKQMCGWYFFDINMAKYMGSLEPFNKDSWFYSKVKNQDASFEFHYLWALVAGIVAVYMFFCYAMAIGVRVAKLGFLQLVAPIPIMMRMIPKQKDKFFGKWLNMIIETYVDVFIRLAIIYFAMFAISLVPDVITAIFVSLRMNGGFVLRAVVIVIVILGIMKFAGDAPKLIKEFIGDTGKYKLESPKKQLESNKPFMALTGAIGGAVSGGVKNFNAMKGNGGSNSQAGLSALGGFGSGAVRGAKGGAKSTNFGELKSNTSSAVDDLISAREDRKYRSQHGGAIGYRLGEAADAVDRWATSDGSLEAMSKQKDTVASVRDGYNQVIDSSNDWVKSHEASLLVTDPETGETMSLQNYRMQNERAQQNYKDFKENDYIKEYMEKNPTSSEETARAAANETAKNLAKIAEEQQNKYNELVDRITDGLVDHAKEFKSTKGSFVKDLEYLSADGKKQKQRVEIESLGEVPGLSDIVDKADNLLEKNKNNLGDLYDTLKADYDKDGKAMDYRNMRNTLRAEVGRLETEIAAKNASQKSDK